MSIEGTNWNVVVAGYWNPAILTPSGIAHRLFGLAPGTPVLIEVPVEGLAPYRVKHENLTVTAELGRLVISADTPRYELLERAKQIAAKAVEGLPETPLTAAGYNVRVKVSDPGDDLFMGAQSSVDASLSDAGFAIESRGLRRALKIGDGVLNFTLQQGEDVTVELNFHRQSHDRDDLVNWLRYPINKVEEDVALILEKVLRIQVGELGK